MKAFANLFITRLVVCALIAFTRFPATAQESAAEIERRLSALRSNYQALINQLQSQLASLEKVRRAEWEKAVNDWQTNVKNAEREVRDQQREKQEAQRNMLSADPVDRSVASGLYRAASAGLQTAQSELRDARQGLQEAMRSQGRSQQELNVLKRIDEETARARNAEAQLLAQLQTARLSVKSEVSEPARKTTAPTEPASNIETNATVRLITTGAPDSNEEWSAAIARRKQLALADAFEEALKATPGSPEQKKLLQETLDLSRAILLRDPRRTNVWIARANAALMAGEANAAWEAGRYLSWLGLEESKDDMVEKIFVQLERKKWLGDAPPFPKDRRASIPLAVQAKLRDLPNRQIIRAAEWQDFEEKISIIEPWVGISEAKKMREPIKAARDEVKKLSADLAYLDNAAPRPGARKSFDRLVEYLGQNDQRIVKWRKSFQGKVVFVSKPAGARIRIVGKDIGETPFSVDLMEDDYPIEANYKGWSQLRKVESKPGVTNEVLFQFTFAPVEIKSNQDDTEILRSSDLEILGKTPVTVQLPVGMTEIIARHQSWQPITKQVEVSADRTNSVTFYFDPTKMASDSAPARVGLYLEGNGEIRMKAASADPLVAKKLRAARDHTGPVELQTFADDLPLVAPIESPSSGAFVTFKFNNNGARMDAIRIVNNTTKDMNFVWAFGFEQDSSFAEWFLIPRSGETIGFLTDNNLGADYPSAPWNKKPWAKKFQTIVQDRTVPKSHALKAGTEYIIWFGFNDDRPCDFSLVYRLVPVEARNRGDLAIKAIFGDDASLPKK